MRIDRYFVQESVEIRPKSLLKLSPRISWRLSIDILLSIELLID